MAKDLYLLNASFKCSALTWTSKSPTNSRKSFSGHFFTSGIVVVTPPPPLSPLLVAITPVVVEVVGKWVAFTFLSFGN